jgi:hypothetical protein
MRRGMVARRIAPLLRQELLFPLPALEFQRTGLGVILRRPVLWRLTAAL